MSVRSSVKAGKIQKRVRAASPPVSPPPRASGGLAGTRDATVSVNVGKTFEERELARMTYNRSSAKLSAQRRASKLSDLRAEQTSLEAAYQARMSQVALLERVIGAARWASVELPCY